MVAIRPILLISAFVLAVLVVICPSLFYTDDATALSHASSSALTSTSTSTSTSTLSLALAAAAREKLQHIHRRIQETNEDLKFTEKQIEKIKGDRRWGSSLTASQKRELDVLNEKAQQQHQVLMALHELKDEMKAQQRALSPIFSQTAVEESREVWWNVQEQYGGMSVRMWKWDMILDMLFGGYNSRDSFAEVIVSAVFKLIWRLTFGVITGIIDFAIRLPFYLKEYALYTSSEHEEILNLFQTVYTIPDRLTDGTQSPQPSPIVDVVDDVVDLDKDAINSEAKAKRKDEIIPSSNEQRGRRHKASVKHEVEEQGVYSEELMNEQHLYQQLQVEINKLSMISDRARQMAESHGHSSSWLSTLQALAFWQLAVLGSCVGGVVLVLLIWSPAFLCCAAAKYAQTQQQPQHYHTD